MPDSGYRENTASGTQGAAGGADEVDNFDDSLRVYRGNWQVLLLIVLIVVAALAGLASQASRWKKGVLVREFVIEGNSLVSGLELSARLKGYKGRNLQELDPEELKERIKVLPYVRDAVIGKELNGIVRVRVIERWPVALAVIDGIEMAVDRDGFLLPGKKEFLARVPKLLQVSGISRLKAAENGLQQLEKRDIELLLQFLDALSGSDYALMLIRELHLEADNTSYCIAVQAPTRFIVGNDGNFKEKLKKFEIFWQKVVSKKGFGSYESVDLRFKGRIFTTEPLSQEVPQALSQ